MVDVRQCDDQVVQEAARWLRAGGLVVLPTETVYGLAACTLHEAAVREVFALKGRPADNPLIAHVCDAAMAATVTSAWPEVAASLAEAFWPGPLTMVLPRSASVPSVATAGLPTIAVRAPRHAEAQAILRAVGQPLSAPSANRSGRVSPTRVSHVVDDYRNTPAAADLLVIDGGACEEGLESTVVDLTGPVIRLLRSGSVSPAAIASVVGPLAPDPAPRSQDASPGTRHRHYAPNKPMVCCQDADVASVLSQGGPASVLCRSGAGITPPHEHVQIPDEPRAAGTALYHLIRMADASSTERIVAALPEGDRWCAVRDRLERGARA